MTESMGDRLREARKTAGFTSTEAAAKAVRVPSSTYRAHENGQNNFGPDEALRYGKVFGVDPNFLLFGTEPKFTDSAVTYSAFAGESAEKIPEIDLVAGMGGGGIAATGLSVANGVTIASELVRAQWEIPNWALQRMGVKARNVACFPCQGDSMEPTITDGDVVFVDTRHRVPSPPGIYALADEFGGVVVKRVEVISNPRDEEVMVRISSDNKHYRDKELGLSEITILGRYICRLAF